MGGVGLSLGASALTFGLGLVRAILLARWLVPEDFGAMALALTFMHTALCLSDLGLDQALNHATARDPGQPDPPTDPGPSGHGPRPSADGGFQALVGTAVLLRAALDGLALLALAALLPGLGGAYPGIPDLARVAAVILPAGLVTGLSSIQQVLVRRNLDFRLLTGVDLASSLAMTGLACWAAWAGWGVWALAVEIYAGTLLRFVVLWFPCRAWVPAPRFGRQQARWLMDYGRPTWGAGILGQLLDRFDDFWVGTYLGGPALGFYSRAWDFARYPRRVLAMPLGRVLQPLFARLQERPEARGEALEHALFATSRGGAVVVGLMALLLPEFVQHLIGPQWTPFILPFRLLGLYALLDPVMLTMAWFLLAVGEPALLRRTRLIQFAFFAAAVLAGAGLAGLEGVAAAASASMALGVVLLIRPLQALGARGLAGLLAPPILLGGTALGLGLVLEGAGAGPWTRLVAWATVLAAGFWFLEARAWSAAGRRMRQVWRSGRE